MTGDSPRILELRRRVQADPASIAFAQLAEECRRSGHYDEAVGICRAGLARHAGYLSARVTLGRSLIELGRLDEAQVELDLVVATAPYNLPAIRGLAEIHQRGGHMDEALSFYRRALSLARHDPDLEEAVGRISRTVKPPAPIVPPAPSVAVEDLFDFDKLLEQLGEVITEPPPATAPPAPPAIAAPPVLAVAAPAAPEALAWPPAPAAEIRLNEADHFAAMERELRIRDEERARDEQADRLALRQRHRQAILGPLESWLAVIVDDRERRART